MCQLPRGKSFCASYLEDVDVESIKKLHASVPTVPLPLPETLSSLDAGLDESSEGHEHAQEEWIRTVYQKKRLLSIKRARASCGVGGTSYEIPHHSPNLLVLQATLALMRTDTIFLFVSF